MPSGCGSYAWTCSALSSVSRSPDSAIPTRGRIRFRQIDDWTPSARSAASARLSGLISACGGRRFENIASRGAHAVNAPDAAIRRANASTRASASRDRTDTRSRRRRSRPPRPVAASSRGITKPVYDGASADRRARRSRRGAPGRSARRRSRTGRAPPRRRLRP